MLLCCKCVITKNHEFFGVKLFCQKKNGKEHDILQLSSRLHLAVLGVL